MSGQSILVVLGTRPEIVKLSPLLSRLGEICERVIVVHSGQHYSYEMDALFFDELQLPAPQYRLNVGAEGLGPGEQTARMLAGLEPIIKREKPDLTLVQGDTNTTLAGALASVKLGVPVLHLEAGCRSFNRAMPEEINRVMVDHVARLLLAPDETARLNLVAEGCSQHAEIFVTGSTGLEACRRAAGLTANRPLLAELNLTPGEYLVVTMHRAENTTPEVLPGLVQTLNSLAADRPVVFPVHPRTAAMMERLGLSFGPGVVRLSPLGYLDMLGLMQSAKAVLTDSGGLQEEAAVLGRPVLVLRQETEWSYLVENGKAALVGNSFPRTLDECKRILETERLARMEAAVIPVPDDISGSILGIVAGFFSQNNNSIAQKRGDLVKI